MPDRSRLNASWAPGWRAPTLPAAGPGGNVAAAGASLGTRGIAAGSREGDSCMDKKAKTPKKPKTAKAKGTKTA
jgi:hypothetical protein